MEYGLEDVIRLKQPVGSAAWSATDGEIWITSPVLMKLADVTDVQLMLADFSRSTDVEAELVDVGEGTSAADYEGLDVSGKVVFARGRPGTVVSQAVFERGALGIVTTALRSTSQPWDHPDQIPWQSVPDMAPRGSDADSWFGFVLSARRGGELEALLAGRQLPDEVAFTGADPSGPVTVRVHIEATFDDADMDTEFIESRINGTDPSLPGIVFTCHVQEEKFSANDDASGCANVLEIGRALTHLMDTGMIPRPLRTMRFWSANEISGPYWYFRTRPEARGDIIVNLHQDMVGALQTEGSRVQHIIRSPHHAASYLADVVESIAEAVIKGNSGYLAAGQAGGRYPFSRPIFSRLGTRDGYRAEVVPNFNNSDHMVFNDGIIGIPAVGFINWPDDYIHSSDDDLWQIDRTQLKRNAFIIAAAALYIANAGADHVGTLLAEVEGRGAERLGNDLRTAMGMVSEGGGSSDTFTRAMWVLEAGEMREQRAVRSVLDFTDGDPSARGAVEAALGRVADRTRAFRESLTGYRTSQGGVPRLSMTAAHSAAAGKVPVNIDDVQTYLSNRPRPSTGLHSLMTFSVWGHVDGEASYLDIYKQVMAEAAVHGAWYYGTVTLDQVEAGILNLR